MEDSKLRINLLRWTLEEQENVICSLDPACPVCGDAMSPMAGLGAFDPNVYLEGELVSDQEPSLGRYATDCVVWQIAFMCNDDECAAEITINHTMQMQYYGKRSFSENEPLQDEPLLDKADSHESAKDADLGLNGHGNNGKERRDNQGGVG